MSKPLQNTYLELIALWPFVLQKSTDLNFLGDRKEVGAKRRWAWSYKVNMQQHSSHWLHQCYCPVEILTMVFQENLRGYTAKRLKMKQFKKIHPSTSWISACAETCFPHLSLGTSRFLSTFTRNTFCLTNAPHVLVFSQGIFVCQHTDLKDSFLSFTYPKKSQIFCFPDCTETHIPLFSV